MDYPKPVPGLVIRYAYLWRSESLRGRKEGVKDRPCAIVLVTRSVDDQARVIVLPITHTPPSDPAFVMELSEAVKERLSLDTGRSWIVLNEVNAFTWPGPDLRPAVTGDPRSVAYGMLPRSLTLRLRNRVLEILKNHHSGVVVRDE